MYLEFAMNAIQINREYDLLSLVSRDTTLKKQGAYYVGPCPFCGGTDRFTLKHTPRGYRWYCRYCGGEKYRTTVDYIMWREHISFSGALHRLGGQIESIPAAPTEKAAPRETPELSDSDWQAASLREVLAASDRLLSDEGKAGRDYLVARGLHRGTWYAWHLGFADIYDPSVKRRRPAIVLPWLDVDRTRETITAVKYRFIDPNPDGLRYSSRRGSVPILFGLWDALPRHDTLLLLEGEINALSAWQCLPSGVSSLSFGSESGGRPEIMKAMARRYRRVFVWTDNPDKAAQIRTLLGADAGILRSPVYNNVQWDANKMLQEGMLMDFLCQVLKVSCVGWPPERGHTGGALGPRRLAVP
jgi:hypothetical protein